MAVSPAEIDRRTGVTYNDDLKKTAAQRYAETFNRAKEQMGGAAPYVPATTDTYLRTVASQPNSSPSRNSGGGGNAGAALAAATAAFNAEKEAAKNEITGIRDSSGTAYDEAVKKLNEHYNTAAQNRGDSFVGGYNELGDNLKNLGIDFSQGDLAKQWDADQRVLTETADTALATDLAWFEKMKTLNTDLYNSMLAEMAKATLANLGGGGGGGGRRRGGGGSGGGDTSVTESGILYNPLLAAAIQGMDPSYQLAFDMAGGNPVSASKTAATNLQKALGINVPYAAPVRTSWNPFQTASSLGKSVASTARATATQKYKNNQINQAQNHLNFFNQYVPGRSPQVTKVTTSTKGRG